MTENEQVLEHLRHNVGLTQREAAQKYGIYRLSARIHQLRKAGHKITTMSREVPTGYERPTTIAEYRLMEE